MSELLSPALLPLFGAAALPWLRGPKRIIVLFALPIILLGWIWLVPDPRPHMPTQFLGYELNPTSFTATGRLFGTFFAIMLFAGNLFAYRQARTLELVAAMIYGGSAVGVALAGDLISLFIFWEFMAIGSTVILWASNQPRAGSVSYRYLLIHLLGGVILMAGIAGHALEAGSIMIEPFKLDHWSHYCILCAFLINAGAPPLSVWIPDAYPETSTSGAVYMCAFTTKAAVYALLVMFAGEKILIYFGLYMIFYGIVYSILENDVRRILAFSSVNQVGFMVTGIGIGTALALNGAAAHACAHIVFKSLMLMSAGSVLYMTGKRKCSELGGLYRTMPVTMTCGIVGAAAISAFPLMSGFASKSLIAAGALDAHLVWLWYPLLIGSAGVFLHAGIKFPWFVFFQKDSGLRPDDPPLNMCAAMILFSIVCVLIGIFPQSFYKLLPFAMEYTPYTYGHVISQLQLLCFSGLAFFLMLPLLKRTPTITLDTDWLYRKDLPRLLSALGGCIVWLGQKPWLTLKDWRSRASRYATVLHAPSVSVTAAVLLTTLMLLIYLALILFKL